MAQKQLNFPKLTAPTKTYVGLIGHETLNIIHPELFTARARAEKDGKPLLSDKGYEKSYDIPEWELGNQVVTAWTSKQSHYGELEPKQKGVINAIKNFLNREEWKCLVVFHGTECRMEKQYTYGNHLHVVIQTTQSVLSKHGKYRSMQDAIQKIGGICTLRPVKADLQGFLKYLMEDNEKIFLGANSEELLDQWRDAETYDNDKGWELGQEEKEDKEQNKRNAVPFIKEVKRSAPPTVEEETEVPQHLQNKKKLVDNVNFLIDMLRKNKDIRDINQLTVRYGMFSQEGQALCNIGLSNNGPKAFALALRQLEEEDNKTTLEEKVKALPDKIENYMDIKSSQAIFNAWCEEQGISARKYAMTMQLLLSEKSYKKIGLYLQGRPNSGKTALTNNMWQCLGSSVGRITKETFCFQDCAGKKLIIGEEVAITEANVDRFKDLLSGGTLMCEIKNRAPAPCTPKIVLINSNNAYTLNIGRAGAEQIKVRIYNYDNLKKTQVLKHMKGHFHPRMFYDNILPLQQDEIVNLTYNTGEWSMEPLGVGAFTGDWSEIHTQDDGGNSEEVQAEQGGRPEEASAAAEVLQPATFSTVDDSWEENNNADYPFAIYPGYRKDPFWGHGSDKDAFNEAFHNNEREAREQHDQIYNSKYNDYEEVSTDEKADEAQEEMLALAAAEEDYQRQQNQTREQIEEEYLKYQEEILEEAKRLTGKDKRQDNDVVNDDIDWNDDWNTQSEPSDADSQPSQRKRAKLSLFKKVTLRQMTDHYFRDNTTNLDPDKTIENVLLACNVFYSRRHDEDKDRWLYQIRRSPTTEKYEPGSGSTIWAPDEHVWTLTEITDGNSSRHPCHVASGTSRGHRTVLTLKNNRGKAVLELHIPAIINQGQKIDDIIIIDDGSCKHDTMVPYTFTIPDTIPLKIKQQDDDDTVADNAFGFIRAFRAQHYITCWHNDYKTDEMKKTAKQIVHLIGNHKCEKNYYYLLKMLQWYNCNNW